MKLSDLVRSCEEDLIIQDIYFKHKHSRIPDYDKLDCPFTELILDYPDLSLEVIHIAGDMWCKSKSNVYIADYLAEKGF